VHRGEGDAHSKRNCVLPPRRTTDQRLPVVEQGLGRRLNLGVIKTKTRRLGGASYGCQDA